MVVLYLYRQSRVFLQGSSEFSDPKTIGQLANEISVKFNGPVESDDRI